MITSQDIKEKTFEKAVFGGYDMGAVDDFLDEAANDFAAMAKENTVLKSKMKVLVEKIEEYRATEDAMRLALLSAQKMSVQIETEAKAKAEALTTEAERNSRRTTADAEAAAQTMLRNAKQALATEEARLAEAKRASAKFIENVRLMCSKQLDYFGALEEARAVVRTAPAARPAPVEDGTRVLEVTPVKAEPQPEEPTRRLDVANDDVKPFEDMRFDIK